MRAHDGYIFQAVALAKCSGMFVSVGQFSEHRSETEQRADLSRRIFSPVDTIASWTSEGALILSITTGAYEEARGSWEYAGG